MSSEAVAEAPSRPSQSEVPARWNRRKVKMSFLAAVFRKMFGSNNHQHQEKTSHWVLEVFFLVEVRGLVRSHYRDHRDPNSTQPRCSQWRSRQERVPCYKNTLSWNTQHLGTRWCSCLGLATLHFMDCIRKIFSGNSATQTITSTRIQMIQLYRFASNYAFFFAESLTKTPLKPWGICFSRCDLSRSVLQTSAPSRRSFWKSCGAWAKENAATSLGEIGPLGWSMIAAQEQNMVWKMVCLGLSSWKKTWTTKSNYSIKNIKLRWVPILQFPHF